MSEIRITVNKDALLVKLRENLANHIKIYEESIEGFKEFARKTLEERLKLLSSGETSNLDVHFSPPKNYSKEYKRAISMIEWHNTAQIDLTADDFACFIDDDWGWIGAWLVSNKRFSKTATDYASGKGF